MFIETESHRRKNQSTVSTAGSWFFMIGMKSSNLSQVTDRVDLNRITYIPIKEFRYQYNKLVLWDRDKSDWLKERVSTPSLIYIYTFNWEYQKMKYDCTSTIKFSINDEDYS